ncbi:flagellar basal body L-ring protein FlgH [Pelagicoccus sp. SDUM812002]|uniref:flagellar basal body L-ring protein FlgH n=1 Tax=Pelagicoccus sp. SDUM812002 TaxID=3041266 RepID=UPI00280DC2F4|nr:flagellar basal body L-ring protein FlgH [Pelagicoccus sp. SDUM812002]MDQ8185966.1 flagellar basal body L-ring protein FlgH [Pelagicoccus sp. SDUM812002]
MRIRFITTIALVLAASVCGKSLWESPRNTERGMFADRTATNVGDILIIQVDEETVANRSSSKTSSANGTLTQALGEIIIPGIIDTSDGAVPSFDLPGTVDSYTGGGSVTESNLLQSKIAVMIIDVQPNGNLIVEGARKVKASGEAQYLVVRGVVRGDDVLADNSVMSANVLNANVELFNEGDLKDAQTKGWVHKLINVANVR